MVKYLKEVWQTSDGKVFGSEGEAHDHENRTVVFSAAAALCINLSTSIFENTRGIYKSIGISRSPDFYMIPQNKMLELLERHGFVYKGKSDV